MRRGWHVVALWVVLLLTAGPWSAATAGPPLSPVTATKVFRIHAADGVTAEARALAAVADESYETMRAQTGGVDGAPIRVVVDRDRGDMLARAFEEQRGRPPEWAAGLAYPARRAIYLHAAMPVSELIETFRHEISHVVFGELPGAADTPLWFKEGLAIHQSEGFSMERGWLLTEAATVGRLMPLSQLDRGFPRGSGRAGVAYAQAVHFIGYLKGVYGEARFVALIEALRQGTSFPLAFETHLGEPLSTIERAWHNRLDVRWGWLPLISGTSAVWGLASILLVLAWRRRRRQRLGQLAAMRALEDDQVAEDIVVVHGARRRKGVLDPYDGSPPTYH